MRKGLSLTEIIIAIVVMVCALFPLIGIFTEGMRVTKITIQEVQASGLAAELVEQMDAVPFEVIEAALVGGEQTWTSENGSLDEGKKIVSSDEICFHLSPLPNKFYRTLKLEMVTPGLVMVQANVGYVLGKRTRDLLLRRYVSKDSSAEVNW